METFKWNGFTFVVKMNKEGKKVYRDCRHLGGPWTDVDSTLSNKSIDSGFRRLLKIASDKVF